MPKLEFGKGSKAAAFETWMQRASLRICGLHERVESYWHMAQAMTAEAYDRYLMLGPMQRSIVRPDSSWVSSEQYGTELRMRPILLEAVPECVRKAALNTRQTGSSSCSLRPWLKQDQGPCGTGSRL